MTNRQCTNNIKAGNIVYYLDCFNRLIKCVTHDRKRERALVMVQKMKRMYTCDGDYEKKEKEVYTCK